MTKASRISVTMLDVGQGSGTFVEIYTGARITATALLDLGSERAKGQAGGPSVDYLVKQLKTMKKPRIDFFSLSHNDSDHINLVQGLLSFFDSPNDEDPTRTVLEIGTVIYGGERAGYKKKRGTRGVNVIADVEYYQLEEEAAPKPLPANNTSYSGSKKPLFTRNDVNIYLLVGNHICSEPATLKGEIGHRQWKADCYSLNTYSLIFVVEFDDWRYVVTGDATGATIAQANHVIETYKVTFPNVAAMTMPHHSSEPTTFGLTKTHGKREREEERVPEAAQEVIEDFAASIKPRSIHASAEQVGNFRHPSAFVMSYFWNDVRKTSWYDDPALTNDQHLYNAYFTADDGYNILIDEVDPTSRKKKSQKRALIDLSGWRTFGTEHAIFTNRYYVRSQAYDPDQNQTATFPPDPAKVTGIPKSGAKNSPPFAVAWRYTSDAATEETTLDRLVNRKDGDDFVASPVMRMSKEKNEAPEDRAAAAPLAAANAAPPSRTMAMRPPARPAMPRPGGAFAPHILPPQRLRQLDA